MTPDEIQQAIADKTFFTKLMEDVELKRRNGPFPGTFLLDIVFPEWFTENVDAEHRKTIMELVRHHAHKAVHEVTRESELTPELPPELPPGRR